MLFQTIPDDETIYKFAGVLWRVESNHGSQWIHENPLCPVEGCRVELSVDTEKYTCTFCKKDFGRDIDHVQLRKMVEKKWEAYKIRNNKVQSLELPVTNVIDEAEDENFWVQARLGDKNGKKTAVIYFGEKIRGVQDKKDYVQSFIDLEDEQVRFDKGNKNPMKMLVKLTAEFPESKIILEKRTE